MMTVYMFLILDITMSPPSVRGVLCCSDLTPTHRPDQRLFPQRHRRLVKKRDHPPRIGDQLFAPRGQHHPPRLPLKKPRAKDRL